MTSRRLNRKTDVDRRIRRIPISLSLEIARFRDLVARSIDLPRSGKLGIVAENAAKGRRDGGERRETNSKSKATMLERKKRRRDLRKCVR